MTQTVEGATQGTNEGSQERGPIVNEGQLSELMQYDSLDAGGKPEGTEEAKTAPAVEQPPQPPPPVAQPSGGIDATAMQEAINKAVEQRLAALSAERQGQAPEASPPSQEDEVPSHLYEIPDQLLQMISSEDPAQSRQGLQVLIAGALRSVHRAVLNQVRQELGTVKSQIPEMMNQFHNIRTKQMAVFEDFYGANPDLKVPQIMPMIHAEAVALAKERPDLVGNGWNQKFRDELSRRVRSILRWQVSTPAQPAAPPKILNGGARPATEKLSAQDKVLADLFG